MPRYVVSVLTTEHERDSFSCGEPSLDTYLKQQARQDVRRDLALCYVLTEQSGKQVLGYYTLSAMSIDLSALPDEMRRHSDKYPVVPAVLLGRLAVDQRLRDQGFGAALMADALQHALRTGVGVRLVVVDALNEAAAHFYEHHGFRRFDDTPMCLYIAVETLRSIYPDAQQTPEASYLDRPNGEDIQDTAQERAQDTATEGQPE